MFDQMNGRFKFNNRQSSNVSNTEYCDHFFINP